MNGSMTTTLFNNSTTLREYKSPDFIPLDSYSFPNTILHYIGWPFTTPSVYCPLHMLVFPNGIQAAFKLAMNSVLDLQT
jgi:hypothetical protein